MTASPQESPSSQKFIRLGYGPVNLLLIQDRLLTDRPSTLHAQFRQTQLLRDHDCNWLNCAQKIHYSGALLSSGLVYSFHFLSLSFRRDAINYLELSPQLTPCLGNY